MKNIEGDHQSLSGGDVREMYFLNNPQRIHQFGPPHTSQQMAYDPQQLITTQDQAYGSCTIQQESYVLQAQVSYSSISSHDLLAKQQHQSPAPYFPPYQPNPRYQDGKIGISGDMNHTHPQSSVDQFRNRGSGQAHQSQQMMNGTARNDPGLPHDQNTIYPTPSSVATNLAAPSAHPYYAEHRAEMMPAYSNTQSQLGHGHGGQREMVTPSHAMSSSYQSINYGTHSSASVQQGFQHTPTSHATGYGQQNYGPQTQSRQPDLATPPLSQPTYLHAPQKRALENDFQADATKRAKISNGLQNSILNTPAQPSFSQAAALQHESSPTTNESTTQASQERIQAEKMLKTFCDARSLPVPSRGTPEHEKLIQFLTARLAQTRSKWNTHDERSAERATVSNGGVAPGNHSHGGAYNVDDMSTVMRTPQPVGYAQSMQQRASVHANSQYQSDHTTVHRQAPQYRRDSPIVPEGNYRFDSQANHVQHTSKLAAHNTQQLKGRETYQLAVPRQMAPLQPTFAPQPVQIDTHTTAAQFAQPSMIANPRNFTQGINQQASQGVTYGQTSAPRRTPPNTILQQRQKLGVRPIYASPASRNGINKDSDQKCMQSQPPEIIDYSAPQYLEMYDYTQALQIAVRESGYSGNRSKIQSRKG